MVDHRKSSLAKQAYKAGKSRFVKVGGKFLLINEEDCEKDGLLFAVGKEIIKGLVGNSEKRSRKAVLYHNSEEIGVKWPRRKREAKRVSKEGDCLGEKK